MYNLGLLSAEISACKNELQQGVGRLAYLINIQDVDKDATDITDLSISSIVYKPGGQPYECEVVDDGIDARCKLQLGPYRNGFDHNITVRVFANDTPNRLRLYELLAGRVIVLFETYQDSGSVWQVAGWELGLEILNLEANWNDSDTLGAWIAELGCDDNYKEKDIPYLLASTTPDTTPIQIGAIPGESQGEDLEGGVLPINFTQEVTQPLIAVLVDPAGVGHFYPISQVTDYKVNVNIGEDLGAGTYKTYVLYAKGTVPVAGAMNYVTGGFTHATPSTGILTINSGVNVDRPLQAYIKDAGGNVQAFDVKRLSATSHEVNVGEALLPGAYTYYMTYIDTP